MRRTFSVLLVLVLGLPWTLLQVSAQSVQASGNRANAKMRIVKIARDLQELLAQDDETKRTGTNQAQIRLGRTDHTLAPKFNGETVPATDVAADEMQSFIVQLDDTASEVVFQERLAQLGGRLSRNYEQTRLVKIEATRNAIRSIAADESVAYVSPDRVMKSLGHVESTTGLDLARATVSAVNVVNAPSSSTLSSTTSKSATTNTSQTAITSTTNVIATLDGTGIGIAVLDSGIDADHYAFLGSDGQRRVTNVDYQNSELATTNTDPYGHGTHVAALAAGNTNQAAFDSTLKGAYDGIAQNSHLYNLRVLDEKGFGKASWLLNALNWIQRNHNKVSPRIRVVNISLGTTAVDSYQTDPLCLMVRRLANLGIVVVASAGNDGKDSNGNKVYGLIHSPANDPSVLTVGASNTFGTDSRADDGVATFSSRGPTRSYWTDAAGNRHYDNLIKPEIVAPGNKLIAARSELSATHLAALNPSLTTTITGDRRAAFMRMSGTSVSTPLVSGTVALMLQINPTLTPNLIKTILMYSAQSLVGFNQFEQGAGQLNIEGALRLSRIVRTNLTRTLGEPLLTNPLLSFPETIIAKHRFEWSQGIVMGATYATGANLMQRYQRVYGTGMLLGDGILMSDRTLRSDATKMTSGITLGTNVLTSTGMLMSDGVPFWSVGQLLGDGMLMSDGMLLSDHLKAQQVLSSGDQTASMN